MNYGFYSGSFDPCHKGHLEIIDYFHDKFDKFHIIIDTKFNKYKQDRSSYDTRIQNFPNKYIKYITCDTSLMNGTCIIGSDNMIRIQNHHKSHQKYIVDYFVICRDNYPCISNYKLFNNFKFQGFSSSLIRSSIKENNKSLINIVNSQELSGDIVVIMEDCVLKEFISDDHYKNEILARQLHPELTSNIILNNPLIKSIVMKRLFIKENIKNIAKILSKLHSDTEHIPTTIIRKDSIDNIYKEDYLKFPGKYCHIHGDATINHFYNDNNKTVMIDLSEFSTSGPPALDYFKLLSSINYLIKDKDTSSLKEIFIKNYTYKIDKEQYNYFRYYFQKKYNNL